MAESRTHKNLEVWKSSIQFVTDIYKITSVFPKVELYGIVAQMRRAAVSVPSNIAEGASRRSSVEFKHFLHIALSSAAELNTQLIISHNIGYLDLERMESLVNELDRISKMLQGLIKSLNR